MGHVFPKMETEREDNVTLAKCKGAGDKGRRTPFPAHSTNHLPRSFLSPALFEESGTPE